MSNEKLAKRYYELGLCTIPVKNKKPLVLWTQYQTIRPSYDKLDGWFSNGADIGIITGKISNIIVLDLDTNEAYAYARDRGLPATWITKTRRGYHYYFKYDPSITGPSTLADLGSIKGLDIRGDGGYVVSYEWFPEHSPWETELAVLPEWIKSLLDNPKTNELKGKQVDHWVKELLKGAETGKRHAALLRLSGYFFSHVPSDIATSILIEWNKKNNPPIEDKILDKQLSDIAGRYMRGEYSSNSTFNGDPQFKPPVHLSKLLVRGVPKIKWLVENVIPNQSAVIIGGREKIGKSWLLHDLAIETAKGGGKWLGKLDVSGGRVLYIDEESTEKLLQIRFSKLLKAKKLEGQNVDIHFMIGSNLNFSDFASVDNLRKQIEILRPRVVFIDSLIRVHMAEENSASDMKKVFRIIKQLKQDYDCIFIIADHERRPFCNTRRGNMLRGTTEKGAFVDSLVSIYEHENLTMFEHTFCRNGPEIGSFAFTIEDTSPDSTVIKFCGRE